MRGITGGCVKQLFRLVLEQFLCICDSCTVKQLQGLNLNVVQRTPPTQNQMNLDLSKDFSSGMGKH